MSHFDQVTLAPADPILSLTDAFKADSNPDKINLSVGVFVDSTGITPVLDTVKEAEKRILAASSTKSYLPIQGAPDYGRLTRELCFGSELSKELSNRSFSLHTPGGTGALRLAADFIANNLSGKTVWISDPSWANHKGIFSSAGLQTGTYAYFDNAKLGLNYGAFLEAIAKIPAGDIVLLHGCCHNPTGADLTPEQWDEVVKIAASRGWIPLVDFAYQGFGDDLHADAYGARQIAQAGLPLIVAQSFSKNFGLYQDRVGALHVVTDKAQNLPNITSQLKVCARVNYSNPPAHGGYIVSTILGDSALAAQWEDEVTAMRNHINGVRSQFVAALAAAGIDRDFSFLTRQKGMFSFTGLNAAQARILKEEHSIYIVGSGRINVAGITPKNMDRIVSTLKTILS